MRDDPDRPNLLVRRWEALSTRSQVLIAIPGLVVLMFLINLGPFNQPVLRSVLYGLFEGGVLGGLVLVVTAQEKAKRARRGGPRTAEEQQRPAQDEHAPEGDPDDLTRQP